MTVKLPNLRKEKGKNHYKINICVDEGLAEKIAAIHKEGQSVSALCAELIEQAIMNQEPEEIDPFGFHDLILVDNMGSVWMVCQPDHHQREKTICNRYPNIRRITLKIGERVIRNTNEAAVMGIKIHLQNHKGKWKTPVFAIPANR
tara:strand:- start:1408 stop:1845 length:438 start_codon:yes stop_codon:yes gene_type:complete